MSELIIRADAENAYQEGYKEGLNAGYQQAMSANAELLKEYEELKSRHKFLVETCDTMYSTLKEKNKTIEELMKEQPHWIPVSERKPKRNGIYIVSRWVSGRAKKVLSDVAYFDGIDTWYDDYDTSYDPDRIIAWMPLPEPYKAET